MGRGCRLIFATSLLPMILVRFIAHLWPTSAPVFYSSVGATVVHDETSQPPEASAATCGVRKCRRHSQNFWLLNLNFKTGLATSARSSSTLHHTCTVIHNTSTGEYHRSKKQSGTISQPKCTICF